MARTTRIDDSYDHDDRRPRRRRPGWVRWAIGVFVVNVGIAGLAVSGYDGGMVSSLTQSAVDRFARTRTTVRNRALTQQVETRIRSEKTLDADQIEIEVEDENTVVLKGLVTDSGDKEKAVSLARDTRGVRRVVDQLAVIPTSRVIDAPAAVDPPQSSGFAELPKITR